MKTQIKARFKVGQTVQMTPEALENYGLEHEGKSYRITSVARAYMPSAQFFASGKPAGYHPGFDESAECALYDFDGLNMSLYDWELV